MNKIVTLIIVFCVVLSSVSCKKDTSALPDSLAIHVLSPADGQIIDGSKGVNIRVVYSDPVQLDSFSFALVYVENSSYENTTRYEEGHTSSLSHEIHTNIPYITTGPVMQELRLRAKNNLGKVVEKKISFIIY